MMHHLKALYRQRWEPGMLRLVFDIEDDTGIAVRKDLFSLKHHLSILQLRRAKANPNHLIGISNLMGQLSAGNSDGKAVGAESAGVESAAESASAGGGGAESPGDDSPVVESGRCVESSSGAPPLIRGFTSYRFE